MQTDLMHAFSKGMNTPLIRKMAPLIGAIFFLIFVVATSSRVPAFQAPDEPIHFARSIEVANLRTKLLKHPRNSRVQGLMYVDLDKIYGYMQLAGSKKISEKESRLLNRIKSSRIKDLYADSHIASMNLAHQMLGYTGVNYAPQALAVKIGETTNQSLAEVYGLGRLIQQLTGAAVFGICIQAVLSYNCWSGVLGCLLITLPMSLQILSSYSGDALVIESAIILAIITEILMRHNWASNSPRGMKIDFDSPSEPLLYISLLASYSFLISKASYLPTALAQAATSIFYLRKYTKADYKKTQINSIILIACITASSASMVSWLRYTTPSMRALFETRLSLDLQLARQHQVAHLSPDFLLVIVNTLSSCGKDLWNQMIGVLGSLDKPLTHTLFYWTISALLIVSAFGAANTFGQPTNEGMTPKNQVSRSKHIYLLAALALLGGFALSTYLVLGAVWTTWSSDTSPIVEGLQGRHLIPLMPIIPVFITALSIRNKSGSILDYSNQRRAMLALAMIGTAVNFLAYFEAVKYWY